MLKLNASYSKKVPAEGEYSSQSYHCSMEVELSDKLEAADIQTKIHETFAMVRDAVEAELHGKSAPRLTVVKTEPAGQAAGKATNKQVKYLLDLGKAKGLGLSELNAEAQKRFRVGSVYELSRVAASQFVDQLKAA